LLNIQLAKNYEAALTTAMSGTDWVAIETEYGDFTINENTPNVILSLNHHGSLQSKKPPALVYEELKNLRYDNFIISHIDLDVLFGILWTAGWLKETVVTRTLSEIIAFADVMGFHRINEYIKAKNIPKNIVDKYFAIGYLVNSWVINDNGYMSKDISKEVHKLLLRTKDIIMKEVTEEQKEKFQTWFREQKEQAKKNLKEIINLCGDDKLFIYQASFSLGTAYTIDNEEAKMIIQYHEQSKSISLGCYDAETAIKYFGNEGVIKPLQHFFGEKAGGKLMIGGTPRGQTTQPEMLSAFIEFLKREYFNTPVIIPINDGL